ncbi:MAG: hypothetical protein GF309_01475 [Candidatus Lokiarchaeota archaeon]|nr:hypothetical protein [Candidatus Lokiarchaeota archaeon]
MNTEEIMEIALEMAGLDEIPGDSGIHVEGEEITNAIIGIDMGTAELMLADRLGYDLVIAHHPPGGESRIHFEEVVKLQIDQMMEAGVPPHVAEKAIKPRLKAVKMRTHVSNYDHNISAAKLLEMPYMNIHLPLDMVCRRRFTETIEEATKAKDKAKVEDALEAMMTLPEMQLGKTEPVVYVGSEDNILGDWTVAMAGGTNGGAGVAKAYFDAGLSTVFYMHIGKSDMEELKEYDESGNLVATGHMASDSVGIAPFVKRLRKEGIDVTAMSGVFVPE